MTTVTDSLFAQASTMAKSSFIREDELRNLPSMTRAQLDALEYGAVKVDDSGVIELYNRYEAELANIQPADAEGKSFFTQVAPCTNNNLFFGSFKKGVQDGELNVLFPYTFTYRMKPTNVLIHLYKCSRTRSNWILVKKR